MGKVVKNPEVRVMREDELLTPNKTIYLLRISDKNYYEDKVRLRLLQGSTVERHKIVVGETEKEFKENYIDVLKKMRKEGRLYIYK